jgi:hypothetical protein
MTILPGLTFIARYPIKEFRLDLPFDQTHMESDAGIVLKPEKGLRLRVTRHSVDSQIDTKSS